MENLLYKFRSNRNLIISLIVIGLLLVSIPLGVYLTQRPHILKSKAQECNQVCDTAQICDPTCRPCGEAYEGECADTGGADVCDGPVQCFDQQVNCRDECSYAPQLWDAAQPPDTGGVVETIVSGFVDTFSNIIPGEGSAPVSQEAPQGTICINSGGVNYCNDPNLWGFLDRKYYCDPTDSGPYLDGCKEVFTEYVPPTDPSLNLCFYNETCPEDPNQSRACHGVMLSDGACGYEPQVSPDCTICDIRPPDVLQSDLARCDLGRCIDGPGAACINDNDCAATRPQIQGIETYLDGQQADLGVVDIADDDIVTIVAHAPPELGLDYYCRWNFDDGQGDSGAEVCQIDRTFPPGYNLVTVYLVTASGIESDRKSINFRVKPPPQISSLDSYVNNQKTRLDGALISLGSNVTVIANVPPELGNDFACRWSVNGDADSGNSECQYTYAPPLDTNTISVYVVNNRGRESARFPITFGVEKPPPPPPPANSQAPPPRTGVGGGTTQVAETITETISCRAYLICKVGEDGRYTGEATTRWSRVNSYSAGGDSGCQGVEPVSFDDSSKYCPVGEIYTADLPRGGATTLEKDITGTRVDYRRVESKPECGYEEKHIEYDCSNGKKCTNDWFSNSKSGCAWVPLYHENGPFAGKRYTCTEDQINCGGRGTGYSEDVTACLPDQTKEEDSCYSGYRWYKNYKRDNSTSCLWAPDSPNYSWVRDGACGVPEGQNVPNPLGKQCSENSQCSEGSFCDNGICRPTEFRESVLVVSGVGNFLGGVKDAAGGVKDWVVDENGIGDIVVGVGAFFGATPERNQAKLDAFNSPQCQETLATYKAKTGIEIRSHTDIGLLPAFQSSPCLPAYSQSPVEHLIGGTFDGFGTAVSTFIENASPTTVAFYSPECQATLADYKVQKGKEIRVSSELWYLPNYQDSACFPKAPTTDQKVDLASSTLKQGLDSVNQQFPESDVNSQDQRKQALKQVLVTTMEQLGAGNINEPPKNATEKYTRDALNSVAESLGLNFDQIEKWDEANIDLFIQRARRTDINPIKAVTGAFFLPADSVENYGLAEDVCIAKYGRACTLRAENSSAYNDLSAHDLEILNGIVKTTQPNLEISDFELVKQYAKSFGAQVEDPYVLNDPIRKAQRAKLLSEYFQTTISIEDLDKIHATFDAYNHAADNVRAQTTAGRQMVAAEQQAKLEVALTAAGGLALGFGWETPALVRATGLGRVVLKDTVRARLIERLGIEAGQGIITDAEVALEKLAIRYELNTAEEAALRQAREAAGEITPGRVETNVREEALRRAEIEYAKQLEAAQLSAGANTAARAALVDVKAIADAGGLDGPNIRVVGDIEYLRGNDNAIKEALTELTDTGNLLPEEGVATPAVVIADSAQANFVDVPPVGLGRLIIEGGGLTAEEARALADQILARINRRSSESVPDDVVRVALDQVDGIQSPVLADAARNGVTHGESVDVLTRAAADVIPEGDVARSLDGLAARIEDKELPNLAAESGESLQASVFNSLKDTPLTGRLAHGGDFVNLQTPINYNGRTHTLQIKVSLFTLTGKLFASMKEVPRGLPVDAEVAVLRAIGQFNEARIAPSPTLIERVETFLGINKPQNSFGEGEAIHPWTADNIALDIARFRNKDLIDSLATDRQIRGLIESDYAEAWNSILSRLSSELKDVEPERRPFVARALGIEIIESHSLAARVKRISENFDPEQAVSIPVTEIKFSATRVIWGEKVTLGDAVAQEIVSRVRGVVESTLVPNTGQMKGLDEVIGALTANLADPTTAAGRDQRRLINIFYATKDMTESYFSKRIQRFFTEGGNTDDLPSLFADLLAENRARFESEKIGWEPILERYNRVVVPVANEKFRPKGFEFGEADPENIVWFKQIDYPTDDRCAGGFCNLQTPVGDPKASYVALDAGMNGSDRLGSLTHETIHERIQNLYGLHGLEPPTNTGFNRDILEELTERHNYQIQRDITPEDATPYVPSYGQQRAAGDAILGHLRIDEGQIAQFAETQDALGYLRYLDGKLTALSDEEYASFINGLYKDVQIGPSQRDLLLARRVESVMDIRMMNAVWIEEVFGGFAQYGIGTFRTVQARKNGLAVWFDVPTSDEIFKDVDKFSTFAEDFARKSRNLNQQPYTPNVYFSDTRDGIETLLFRSPALEPCPIKFGVIPTVYAQSGSNPCPTNPFAAIVHNVTNGIRSTLNNPQDAAPGWFNRMLKRKKSEVGENINPCKLGADELCPIPLLVDQVIQDNKALIDELKTSDEVTLIMRNGSWELYDYVADKMQGKLDNLTEYQKREVIRALVSREIWQEHGITQTVQRYIQRYKPDQLTALSDVAPSKLKVETIREIGTKDNTTVALNDQVEAEIISRVRELSTVVSVPKGGIIKDPAQIIGALTINLQPADTLVGQDQRRLVNIFYAAHFAGNSYYEKAIQQFIDGGGKYEDLPSLLADLLAENKARYQYFARNWKDAIDIYNDKVVPMIQEDYSALGLEAKKQDPESIAWFTDKDFGGSVCYPGSCSTYTPVPDSTSNFISVVGDGNLSYAGRPLIDKIGLLSHEGTHAVPLNQLGFNRQMLDYVESSFLEELTERRNIQNMARLSNRSPELGQYNADVYRNYIAIGDSTLKNLGVDPAMIDQFALKQDITGYIKFLDERLNKLDDKGYKAFIEGLYQDLQIGPAQRDLLLSKRINSVADVREMQPVWQIAVFRDRGGEGISDFATVRGLINDPIFFNPDGTRIIPELAFKDLDTFNKEVEKAANLLTDPNVAGHYVPPVYFSETPTGEKLLQRPHPYRDLVPCPVGFNIIQPAYAATTVPCPEPSFFQRIQNTIYNWFNSVLTREKKAERLMLLNQV